jgi:hypothetical protein
MADAAHVALDGVTIMYLNCKSARQSKRRQAISARSQPQFTCEWARSTEERTVYRMTNRRNYSDSMLNDQLVAAALLEQAEFDQAIAAYLDALPPGGAIPVPCCPEMLKTGKCKYTTTPPSAKAALKTIPAGPSKQSIYR